MGLLVFYHFFRLWLDGLTDFLCLPSSRFASFVIFISAYDARTSSLACLFGLTTLASSSCRLTLAR
jgi:hypothetical protein